MKYFVNGDRSFAVDIGQPTPITSHTSRIHRALNIETSTLQDYKRFIGNIPLLPNKGNHIIDAIVTSTRQGASDGSWIETQGEGTWGYVLATNDTLDSPFIGSGNCMLHNATNAQTAEHYGALGVLSFLLLLSRTNHLLPCDYTGKYIVIWIDNAEVQRRFNTKPKSIKVGTYVLADMELWHTIHAIKALLPFKVVSQLVKWHQDRHHKFEDLEFNAQLNILADKAADTQYTHNNPYQETPPLPFGGVIYYRDKNGREITDTYKYLQHEHHGGKLRDYIQKKTSME